MTKIERNPIWQRQGRAATRGEVKQAFMESCAVVTPMKVAAGLLHECGDGISFTKKGRDAWLARRDRARPEAEVAEDLIAYAWWSMQSVMETELPDTCSRCGAAL